MSNSVDCLCQLMSTVSVVVRLCQLCVKQCQLWCHVSVCVCQRCQADHNKKENQKLSDQLSFEKLERSSYEKMVRDMESLRRQAEEHEKTIEALQLACTVSTLSWLHFFGCEIISWWRFYKCKFIDAQQNETNIYSINTTVCSLTFLFFICERMTTIVTVIYNYIIN